MTDVEKLLGRVSPAVAAMSAYNASRPPCRIKLDGNESPFNFSLSDRREMFAGVERALLNRYPDPDCRALREAVSKQSGIPPGGMVFGNGSDELIQMVVQTFCGGTETVLVAEPTFSMYALTAEALGKKVVRQSLDEQFDLETDAMLRALDSHSPDVVFLASPNSPTGNLLSPEKVEAVIARAPGIVVVDEAYFNFCGATHIPLMEKYGNLAVMRTFSKIGFAGMRLGVVFIKPPLAAELSKVRLPYNINSFTQAAALAFFENAAMFEQNAGIIKTERKKMFGTLGSIEGIKVFPSDANFFLIRFPGASVAADVHRKLIEKGVLVRDFSGGKVSDCLRVTIGLPEENREFEKSLREIVSSFL